MSEAIIHASLIIHYLIPTEMKHTHLILAEDPEPKLP